MRANSFSFQALKNSWEINQHGKLTLKHSLTSLDHRLHVQLLSACYVCDTLNLIFRIRKAISTFQHEFVGFNDSPDRRYITNDRRAFTQEFLRILRWLADHLEHLLAPSEQSSEFPAVHFMKPKKKLFLNKFFCFCWNSLNHYLNPNAKVGQLASNFQKLFFILTRGRVFFIFFIFFCWWNFYF